MALPPEITAKLAKSIRMLLADEKGMVFAACCAMARLLESNGLSFHDLADHVQNSGLTEDYKNKVRAEIDNARAIAYAEGVKAEQARQHGTGVFRDTDGKLDWKEIALYCQREIHRLDLKHHEFINDMAARTIWDREPTQRQHQYLHSLFLKLGGKIT